MSGSDLGVNLLQFLQRKLMLLSTIFGVAIICKPT